MSNPKMFCGMSGTCDPMAASKAQLSASTASISRNVTSFIRPGIIDSNNGSGRVRAIYDRLGATNSTNPEDYMHSSKASAKDADPKADAMPEPAPAKMSKRTAPL